MDRGVVQGLRAAVRARIFERAKEDGYGYNLWAMEHAFLIVPVQGVVKRFVDTLKDFLPRGKGASISIDHVLEAASKPPGK